jgi:hypothetical protein
MHNLRHQKLLKKNLTTNPELLKIAIDARKNALLNCSDDEKKFILQEYVDRIVIHSSDSIDYFDAGTHTGFLMVEARGVEPLSENIATQASTGVVTVLMSP